MRIRQATGLIAWCLRKAGRWAICLPPFGVFVLADQWLNRDLLRHEGRHWLQYEQMGLFKFYWLYLWYSIRYGYENNPMEIDARQ